MPVLQDEAAGRRENRGRAGGAILTVGQPLLIERTILSLCDPTGAWPRPYAEAGYNVIRIEIEEGTDVRLLDVRDLPPVHGILAAPPCTHLGKAGARWWSAKGESALLEGLSVVDACLRIVIATRPLWWALENPEGRLRHYLGPPVMVFDPCDYGDPYRKKTLLWGQFNMALRGKPVEPEPGCWVEKFPESARLAGARSLTPAGFAQAFFEANP